LDAETVDAVARRIRLWIGAATLLITTAAVGGTWTVQRATLGVRTDLNLMHGEIASLAAIQARQAERDSARFERAMVVLNLAVGAIVEPAGSEEKQTAIAELRRLRHFTP
jgi:hypothetical protein